MFNIYDSTPIKFRPSLIELSKLSGSYGLVNYMIIDPASSDDEPEDVDLEPSVRQVCETEFDIYTLIQLEVNFLFILLFSLRKMNFLKVADTE